jgi:hypothetical protein
MSSPGTPKGSWGYDLRMATTAVPVEVPPRASNRRYLETKRAKLAHRLHDQDLRFESDEQ